MYIVITERTIRIFVKEQRYLEFVEQYAKFVELHGPISLEELDFLREKYKLQARPAGPKSVFYAFFNRSSIKDNVGH